MVSSCVVLQEALSRLQLSAEQLNRLLSSQLLPVAAQRKSEDEEQLATLQVRALSWHTCSVQGDTPVSVLSPSPSQLQCEGAALGASSLSRRVFAVVRGAALLWETHTCSLHHRQVEQQQQLQQLRHGQQRHLQVRAHR